MITCCQVRDLLSLFSDWELFAFDFSGIFKAHTDQKIRLAAHQHGKYVQRPGIYGGESRTPKHEGQLLNEQDRPDAEKGALLELQGVQGVEDVGNHEPDRQSCHYRNTTHFYKEGRAGNEGDADSGVVGEGGRGGEARLNRSGSLRAV